MAGRAGASWRRKWSTQAFHRKRQVDAATWIHQNATEATIAAAEYLADPKGKALVALYTKWRSTAHPAPYSFPAFIRTLAALTAQPKTRPRPPAWKWDVWVDTPPTDLKQAHIRRPQNQASKNSTAKGKSGTREPSSNRALAKPQAQISRQ